MQDYRLWLRWILWQIVTPLPITGFASFSLCLSLFHPECICSFVILAVSLLDMFCSAL